MSGRPKHPHEARAQPRRRAATMNAANAAYTAPTSAPVRGPGAARAEIATAISAAAPIRTRARVAGRPAARRALAVSVGRTTLVTPAAPSRTVAARYGAVTGGRFT